MYGHPNDRRILLAQNTRTRIKAKIKRASKIAQREATQLVGRDIKALEQTYRAAAADISTRIGAYQNDDGVLTLQVLNALMGDIEQRLAVLSQARNAALAAAMDANAKVATQPFLGEVLIDADLARVSHEAVQFVQGMVAADGLQLSDRLWRIDRGAREALGEAVESAIIQGHSAIQAAQNLIDRGVAVPPGLAQKTQAAQATTLGRVPIKALVTGELSAYAQAERVFRTEINRAHIETYRASGFSHPDVIGTQFLLSPRHPKPDICDMHASANIYGLGAGVYPEGKSPLPAHPNTLSYEVVVFDDEVTDEDRKGKETRIDWLKKQTLKTKVSILGINKAWALDSGHLTQAQITTPWRILKQRLERKGIRPPDTVVAIPAARVARTRSESKLVSSAFNILGYKTISNDVLSIIDDTHSDGILPIIPIKANASRKAHGSYVRTRVGDQAIEIKLSQFGTHKAFTLAHEIGHFIDHQGLPEVGMSSEFSKHLDRWRDAVMATPEIKKLELNQKSLYGKPRQYNEYLLRRREIWARSYSQWLAQRSKNKTLLTQLEQVRAEDLESFPTQWQKKNFEPIADEIDNLFEGLGWLTTQN